MEQTEKAPGGSSEQPLIALHKKCDSPQDILLTAQHQRSGPFDTSATFPFTTGGYLALPEVTDEHCASI